MMDFLSSDYSLELPGGVSFGRRCRGVQGSGKYGGGGVGAGPLVNSCSASEMVMASRPGGAGCKVAISRGFCVAFHLWS